MNEDILVMCVQECFGIKNIASEQEPHALKTTAYGIIGLIAREYKNIGINQTKLSKRIGITRVHLSTRAKMLAEEVEKNPMSMEARYLKQCKNEIATKIALQNIQKISA